MKTEEEVRALKANWQQDPIWVLEDTEGFEEYRDELAQFRKECEIGWAEAAERRFIRSTKYNIDKAVQAIGYYNNYRELKSSPEMILMLAQAHAMLAIVAELQRANDLREGA